MQLFTTVFGQDDPVPPPHPQFFLIGFRQFPRPGQTGVWGGGHMPPWLHFWETSAVVAWRASLATCAIAFCVHSMKLHLQLILHTTVCVLCVLCCPTAVSPGPFLGGSSLYITRSVSFNVIVGTFLSLHCTVYKYRFTVWLMWMLFCVGIVLQSFCVRRLCEFFFEIVGTERHCGNEHAVVKNCVRKLNLCEMWELLVPSVLWHCWLGGRKGFCRPVKNWGVRCWRGYLSGSRCRLAYMAQLMPLPLTVSCSSKIQIGFTFVVPAHLGTMRYDMRCYFNMRSKADMSQLNLLHGNDK